jgi:hypothetical protein
MLGKSPKVPGRFARVFARFGKKRVKSRAFRLAHFNISAPNRLSRARINDSATEKRHFRGVRGNPFS